MSEETTPKDGEAHDPKDSAKHDLESASEAKDQRGDVDHQKRIQEVVDREVGGMRANIDVLLTHEELGGIKMEAARVVSAEEKQKRALNQSIGSEGSQEENLIEYQHAQEIEAEARGEMKKILLEAKNRVMPPMINSESRIAKFLANNISSVAGIAGLGAFTAVSTLGRIASSNVSAAVQAAPWLVSGASVAGFLGAMTLGSAIGGKAESMIRRGLNLPSRGRNTIGKFFGGASLVTAMALNAPVTFGGGIIAAGTYSAYRIGKWTLGIVTKKSQEYKNAELLRSIYKDEKMPKGMSAMAYGTTLYLEYRKKSESKSIDSSKSKVKDDGRFESESVDVAKAKDKEAMRLLIRAGIDKLEKKITKEDAKRFNALLGDLELPEGMRFDLKESHERKLKLIYEDEPFPVDCTEIPDSQITKHIEREARVHQHDVDAKRQLSFEKAVAELKLPDRMLYEPAANRTIKLSFEGHPYTLSCARTPDAEIVQTVENSARAFYERINHEKYLSFTKIVSNYIWTRNIYPSYVEGKRMIVVHYREKEEAIDFTNIDDASIHKVISARIGSWITEDRTSK